MSKFEAKVLAASVNTAGDRLTTFQLTYPRFIHAELMTHRMFSRNAASSRAIPVQTMIKNVLENPVIPIHWGANQKGMQAFEVLSAGKAEHCERLWLEQRDAAVACVQQMLDEGLHKQIANRLLEPWMWIVVICSTTSFEHFRRLRCHPAAEPHFQKLAGLMADAYDGTEPTLKQTGEWHLPLTGFEGDESLSVDELVMASTARCARVSYLTHDGTRDVQADLDLHDRLSASGHWSPFEHPAKAWPGIQGGNFKGWIQHRQYFASQFVRDPKVFRTPSQVSRHND